MCLRVAALFLCPATAQCAVVERRKIGRPSKGERELIRARVPVALRRAVDAEAERRGMTLNDFIGELLAEHTGVPYSPQEALKTA